MAIIGARTDRVLRSVKPKLADAVRQALIAAPDWLDFSVIAGLRSAEEQRKLWMEGRDETGNIVDPKAVVTHRDGVNRRSRHQDGTAIDIVDHPVTWDRTKVAARSAYIIGFAAALGVRLTGGVKWGWDEGHIELEQE